MWLSRTEFRPLSAFKKTEKRRVYGLDGYESEQVSTFTEPDCDAWLASHLQILSVVYNFGAHLSWKLDYSS